MAPSQGWLKGASDPGPLHTHRTPGRGRDPSPARCGSGQGTQPAPSPAPAASSLESLPGYTKGQVDAASPLGAGEGGVPQASARPGPARRPAARSHPAPGGPWPHSHPGDPLALPKSRSRLREGIPASGRLPWGQCRGRRGGRAPRRRRRCHRPLLPAPASPAPAAPLVGLSAGRDGGALLSPSLAPSPAGWREGGGAGGGV